MTLVLQAFDSMMTMTVFWGDPSLRLVFREAAIVLQEATMFLAMGIRTGAFSINNL